MRVCLVYDCLFPHTVGGAERWYRNLAERLAAEGHDVTYLTLRQWARGEDPGVPGVRVVPVGPRMALYVGGRRRIMPPLVFGAGVLAHLLRHGRHYDVVQTASFPYFSLLAAAAARRLAGFRLLVDWFELWTNEYWREYLGPIGGRIGSWVQRLCLRVPQEAFCFSALHRRRLEQNGFRGKVTVLEGLYAGDLAAPHPSEAEPVVVFAGRHIPEKRVPALIPPELRADIFGDGPDRAEVLRLIDAEGLAEHVYAPGFVTSDEIDAALGRALCMVLPSKREGYGLIVIEAASKGTPCVVVRDPDNAAVELVDDGVNGVIAPSTSPEDLAAAILRVHEAGQPLRESTARWFERNAKRLSSESSLRAVSEAYAA
jgi:glycosyltransferase involved in cell wall biosynthesis